MNDVQLCLLAAKTLISDPADWTRCALARRENGRECGPITAGAIKWCALGVVYAVDASNFGERSALTHLLECSGGNIASFNNSHTHAEVMALFDRAIARAAHE